MIKHTPCATNHRSRLVPLAAALAATLAVSACASTDVAPTPSASAPAAPVASATSLTPGAAGVVSLEGVRYRILKSGPAGGAHPSRADDIVVRYEGRLTNGALFDSSSQDKTGTATFPLGKLIPGWIASVQLMRPGDEWLIQIPSYMAYGAKGVGPIPPNADLVFKVELISFSPHKGP